MRFSKAGDLMKTTYLLFLRGSRLRKIYSRVSGLYDIVGSGVSELASRRE